MNILNQKSQILEETTLGIYVWEMPDGRWIGDDDGNFLSVTSKKGNRSKMDSLAREVRSYGIYEGQPKFLSGRRKIDFGPSANFKKKKVKCENFKGFPVYLK